MEIKEKECQNKKQKRTYLRCNVVILYMTEQNLTGRLGCFYQPIRNYRVENSSLGRSIELDGLAEEISTKKTKALLVVECKYRKAPFSLKMFEHLKKSVSVLGEYDPIDYWLFSKAGFDEGLLNYKDPHVHLKRLTDIIHNYGDEKSEIKPDSIV